MNIFSLYTHNLYKIIYMFSIIYLLEANHLLDPNDLEITAKRPQKPIYINNTNEEDSVVIDTFDEECTWCHNNSHAKNVDFKTESIDIPPGSCVVIMSDNYPNKYKTNIDYRYEYLTVPGSILTLDIPTGGMQKSFSCTRDKLIIKTTSQTTRVCGKIRDLTRTSESPLNVRFSTNHRLQWQGYNGTVCASELTTTTTTSTTSTTTAPPLFCDDICGDLNYFPSTRLNIGQDITHMYPWFVIVDIIRASSIIRCGGYLISRNHVVTSAYCFDQGIAENEDPTPEIRLTAGESDLTLLESPEAQIIITFNVIKYPSFDPTLALGLNNVALIIVDGHGFQLNERVLPICLGDNSIFIAPFEPIEVGGYGWTSSNRPVLKMKMITMQACPFNLGQNLVCFFIASPISPCHGDTGTPMVKLINGKYYAVAQVNTITDPFCPLMSSFHPATKISPYLSWINSITNTRMCTHDFYLH